MMNKVLILFVLTLLAVNPAYAQKNYEILKIDQNSLETMNVIYLKKKSLLDNGLYRIVTHKSDTLIAEKKEIEVGDILKLKLVSSKVDIDLKDGFFEKPDKDSFFYKDTYEGKSVNIDYYCPDFVGLYYIGKK